MYRVLEQEVDQPQGQNVALHSDVEGSQKIAVVDEWDNKDANHEHVGSIDRGHLPNVIVLPVA